MPNWNAYSEPWMISMMEAVKDYLAAICVVSSITEKNWRGVPLFSLNDLRFTFSNRIKATLFGGQHYEDDALLLALIKEQRIDVVFGHYGSFIAGFDAVWKKVQVKLLIHMHGVDAHLHLKDAFSGELVQKKDYLSILKNLSENAVIIANSRYTKSLLEKDFGINEERIMVKYISVAPQEYIKQHIHSEEVKIVAIGRLVDFKSPDRTIQAFEAACALGLKGTLTLIGDGYMYISCVLQRERSAFKERIKILGPLKHEEALKHLKEADIFTQHNMVGELSGQTECLGISVLEALSLGIPVVATRSGGVNETVLDQETGILVDPEDVLAQAQALLRLSKQPLLREQMGKAGKNWVLTTFAHEAERQKLLSLIEN